MIASGWVGLPSFLQKLRDLCFEQRHLRGRLAVARGAVFTAIGEDLRTVERQSHPATRTTGTRAALLEHLVNAAGQQPPVFGAKGADRIANGMMMILGNAIMQIAWQQKPSAVVDVDEAGWRLPKSATHSDLGKKSRKLVKSTNSA